MSTISERKSDVAEAARAFLSDISMVPFVVENPVVPPGRKRSPSMPDRHASEKHKARNTAREFLMSIDLVSEGTNTSSNSSSNTSANATPKTPKSSPHKQTIFVSPRTGFKGHTRIPDQTFDGGPGVGIAIPGSDSCDSDCVKVASHSLGSSPSRRAHQRMRKDAKKISDNNSMLQQVSISPVKPVPHRSRRAETVPEVFPADGPLFPLQDFSSLNKIQMFVGHRGIEEACNQSHKTQKHIRLFFTSGGGRCSLIGVSYKLDKHVKTSDLVPLSPSVSTRKSFDTFEDISHNWSEGTPEPTSSDSEWASLSSSTRVDRQSFKYCLKATWTVNGFAFQPVKMLDSWDERNHHATVIALNGFRCSIVPYMNKHDAKEEMNDHFRRKHIVLGDSKIKLTKLRKHKMALLRINYRNHFDIWTCALALCFIDDVLKRGIVRKDTLSLACACCYLLAAKFNEMLTPAAVKSLRDSLTKDLKLSSSSISQHEFFFFSGLEFSLFRDVREVEPYLVVVNSKMPSVKELESGPIARPASEAHFD